MTFQQQQDASETIYNIISTTLDCVIERNIKGYCKAVMSMHKFYGKVGGLELEEVA